MGNEENNKEQMPFVYNGKFKENVRAAGDKMRGSRPTRIAAIAAAAALGVIVIGAVILMVSISRNTAGTRNAPQETAALQDSTTAEVTDSLAVRENGK